MSDLPGFPIEPLPAPADAFEGVAARARARRTRTALVGGGLALALGVGGVGAVATFGGTTSASGDRLGVVASSEPEPTTEASPAPAPMPSTTARPSAGPEPTSGPSAPAGRPTPASEPTVTEPMEPDEAITYRGKVVDADGRPLPGIYVYAVRSSRELPRQVALTGADGVFEVPCETRLLVSSWKLGTKQPLGTRNLALTWVGGARTFSQAPRTTCGEPGDAPQPTTMRVGATVEGAFRSFDENAQERPFPDGGNPGGGLFCDAIGLTDGSGQCSDWLVVDGRYRFTGIPTGRYTLQTTYAWDDEVDLIAGTTTTRDWYHCLDCQNGRPAPAG